MGRNKTHQIWLSAHHFFFRVFSVFRGILLDSFRKTHE